MGDLWPGNVLLQLDQSENNVSRVHIIDWEMAKPGLPGLDLGQFCAEMELVAAFIKGSAHAAQRGIEALLSSYVQSGVDADERRELARRIVVHVGAHLSTWTARVPWGGVEDTRKVVLEGARLVAEGTASESDVAKRVLRCLEIDDR
jgi:thiamine kinase-like enzyme